MTIAPWLAPDPAVPQRDVLLDDKAISSLMRTRFGQPVSVRIGRIKYRVGESLRVVYRVSAPGIPQRIVSVRTRNRAAGGPMPSSVTFGDEGLQSDFWLFPADRRLDGLGVLLRPPENLHCASGGRHRARLVSYAPEKCAVAAWMDDRGRVFAYAKKHADAGAAREAFDRHSAIARLAREAGAPRVPDALALDETRHITVVAAAPGTRLADADDSTYPAALRALGRAAAELHSLPTNAPLPRWSGGSAKRLRQAAALVGLAQPSIRPSVERLATALIGTAPVGAEAVTLHADLHLKNALAGPAGLFVIDLDQAAVGAAASDIAGVLAWLRTQAIVGLMPRSETAALAEAFLDGYRDIRRLPDRGSLRWHTAVALLEQRALRAINRVRVALLPHLDALVADALLLCGERRLA